MERIRNLNRYQKALLAVLTLMALVFGAVYHVVSSRVGYLYENRILLPSEQGGNQLYSGTIDGRVCTFTVTADGTVTLRHGDRVYGPYTVRDDPTAKPEDEPYMTGVEILDGEQVFFRGGYWPSTDGMVLFHEDGGIMVDFYAYTVDGTTYDADGNIVDPMEPSAADILELVDGPALTSKGQWQAWFGGVFCSMLIAATILFSDELFYLSLSFRIRNPDHAEPSDWELAGRYISWTGLTVLTLVLYIVGLQ